MKRKVHKELLSLLVRVYNHSIQSYYYFPEVIIYGRHRLEKQDFERLLSDGWLTAYYADSFGRMYRLSKKAEEFLYTSTSIRKRKSIYTPELEKQSQLQFC